MFYCIRCQKNYSLKAFGRKFHDGPSMIRNFCKRCSSVIPDFIFNDEKVMSELSAHSGNYSLLTSGNMTKKVILVLIQFSEYSEGVSREPMIESFSTVDKALEYLTAIGTLNLVSNFHEEAVCIKLLACFVNGKKKYPGVSVKLLNAEALTQASIEKEK